MNFCSLIFIFFLTELLCCRDYVTFSHEYTEFFPLNLALTPGVKQSLGKKVLQFFIIGPQDGHILLIPNTLSQPADIYKVPNGYEIRE